MTLSPPPRRVLIVRMSHLGDIAQAIPLAHAVRRWAPEAELGWAIQPEFAALVEPFARVFPFERGGGLSAWPKLRSALRAWGPDVALDAQGNWKSAAAVRASGARRRFGFARAEWQEPLASRLARCTEAPAGVPHLVARCHRLAAAAFGGSVEEAASLPIDPMLSESERQGGRDTLSDLRVSRAPILLHPGVEGDPRTWPAERFEAAAMALAEDGQGARVVVLTGPGERRVGERLRERVPDVRHVVGQSGLRAFAALLSAAAEQGGRLVGGDSGPAHLAASVGLPVHLLAGPEDPSKTGPWTLTDAGGRLSHVVAAPDGWRPGDAWVRRSIEDVLVDDLVNDLRQA